MRHERGGWLTVGVAILRPLVAAAAPRSWGGAEHVPSAGGVVVALNHTSYIDPLTAAHYIADSAGRAPRFLAKASLFEVPVVGPWLRAAGQIPVRRESREAGAAYEAAVAAVRAGRCVCVYPEGTITRDPDGWPMAGKTGAARIALATGAPLVPVAQWGPAQVLSPHPVRLRVLPRPRVKVLAGPPVDLSAYAGRHPTQFDLLLATDDVMAALTGLVAQLRGVPAPPPPTTPKHTARRPAGPELDPGTPA